MGAINYGTSDYITIGLEPFDTDDYIYEDEDGEEDINYDARRDDMDYTWNKVEKIRARYAFDYYNVKLEWGYHEGFYIDIKNTFGSEFDSSADKREAQKEITQIKRFLLECVEAGCVQCFPGWCTGYASHKETLAGINEAVKAMREEVRQTPTWYTCEKKGAEV